MPSISRDMSCGSSPRSASFAIAESRSALDARIERLVEGLRAGQAAHVGILVGVVLGRRLRAERVAEPAAVVSWSDARVSD